MSAQDQMRKMLDELMGSGRDGTVPDYVIPFSDGRVCRNFLLNCCPHEILLNTRMDLGRCPKIHDPALKADFEKASKTKNYYYDEDAIEYLDRFFADCDRRSESAKKRLQETQEELSPDCAEKANKVLELNEKIGKSLAEAEKLGEEGKVDESLLLMAEMEDLRREKQAAEQSLRESMPASSYQQQKLRACEICGAFLGIHDNDRRLADHFGGKLHMGFLFLRERLTELNQNVAERREKRSKERSEKRSDDGDYYRKRRSRSRSRDRFRNSKYYKRSSRSRSKSRSKSSRDRNRSGSREDGSRHSSKAPNRKRHRHASRSRSRSNGDR